ncbi:hypothetical protein LTR94_032658, partial [Friedmanniomyces endolithicus]
RPADAGLNRHLRSGLCRGRHTGAASGRVAGHLLGAGAVGADHADGGGVGPARRLERHRGACVDRSGLCLGLLDAGRLHLLVSRPGDGRHRQRGAASTAPALLRPGAGGSGAARGRAVDHGRGGRPDRGQRRRGPPLCL